MCYLCSWCAAWWKNFTQQLLKNLGSRKPDTHTGVSSQEAHTLLPFRCFSGHPLWPFEFTPLAFPVPLQFTNETPHIPAEMHLLGQLCVPVVERTKSEAVGFCMSGGSSGKPSRNESEAPSCQSSKKQVQDCANLINSNCLQLTSDGLLPRQKLMTLQACRCFPSSVGCKINSEHETLTTPNQLPKICPRADECCGHWGLPPNALAGQLDDWRSCSPSQLANDCKRFLLYIYIIKLQTVCMLVVCVHSPINASSTHRLSFGGGCCRLAACGDPPS